MPIMAHALQILSVNELMQAAQEVDQHFRSTPWFRGQSLASWSLAPKIYRSISADPAKPVFYTRDDEQGLIVRFQLQAHSRRADCPPDGDLARWLCLMQHYGLPTRLLDWTESILIAAFFAVWQYDKYKDRKEPAALWALSPYELNRHQINTDRILLLGTDQTTLHQSALEQSLRSTIDESILKPTDATKIPRAEVVQRALRPAFYPTEPDFPSVFAAGPPEIDFRMLLQQSTFTIHTTATKPLDELGEANDLLMRFEIPFPKIPEVQDGLARLGITQAKLFPDLQNLAEDLEKHCTGFRMYEGNPPPGPGVMA